MRRGNSKREDLNMWASEDSSETLDELPKDDPPMYNLCKAFLFVVLPLAFMIVLAYYIIFTDGIVSLP